MSTSTITAPSSERTTPQNPRSRKRVGEPSLHARYVGAMLYFVGAALIAGAVVHYPIDPPVYTVICIVGAWCSCSAPWSTSSCSPPSARPSAVR